ncbi:hypothetical protein EON83_28435 [bacterium]|nr:MAG: hypothetical protein EON83_28435 [bacterium]
MAPLVAVAARALPLLARAAPAAGASSSALAARALPSATALVSLSSSAGAGRASDRLSRSNSNSKDDCCCPCEGGKGGGSSPSGGGSGGNGIAAIADAIKTVSDSFTGTIINAGQAFTSTVNTLGAGANSVIGNVTSTISSTVSSLAKGITSLTASLGPVGAIIGGIASAASAVTSAVMGVASSVASVVISIGTGLLNTATTVVTTAASLVGNAVGMATTFVSTISGLITSLNAGLSAVFSIIGTWATAIAGIFAGIANAVGTVIGAITSIISGIVSTITSVVSALTSAFKSLSESLGALAGIAGEALGGLISAIQSCIDSLISFARNVSSIRDNTGMSLASAANLTTDLQAVGIASKETAHIFSSIQMRPAVFNPRSNMMGLANVDDPNFAVNEARLFQKLVKEIGYVAAKSRLDAQFGGKAPDSVVHMVNTDPRVLQENLDYGRKVQGQLGIGPSQIKAASEDLPLLMNRIATFIETVRIKFAAELLPALEGGFNVVSGILADKAGSIADLIKSATYTIFVDGPDIAANAALTVLDWAQALSNGFFSLVNAGIAFARTFMDGKGPVFGMLEAGANFIDTIVEFGAKFAGGMSALGAIIKTAIIGVLMALPGGVLMMARLGLSLSDIEDPTKAFQRGYNSVHRNTGLNDWLQNTRKQMQPAATKVLDNLADGSANAQNTFNALKKDGSNMINTAHANLGTHDMREQQMKDAEAKAAQEKALELQKQQLAVSKQHLAVAKNANSDLGGAGQIIARMGAYLAQDAYRLTSR